MADPLPRPALHAPVGQKLGMKLLLLAAPAAVTAPAVPLLGSAVVLFSDTVLLLVVVSLVDLIELVL